MSHPVTATHAAQITQVLLVDDHPAFSRLVELFANKWGKGAYKVTAVASIEEAVTALTLNAFDAILLDGRLSDDRSPGENAEILAETYRGPIILFSGMSPMNFSTSSDYSRFVGSISKDDLPKEHFVDQIQSFIYKHREMRSAEANK
ncbi:response regulator [Ponticaulis sp.]|uniref:response regulator n=1 Tax=Ponticaulis sp. TaxID=2020902 RepID=UPI000C4E0722|nr:response regulator [Ponticaulis sp.]MAJ10303.1 hypothetical protein [Ponticaulis sp.]HBH89249.1 hypothetical protein [Hyphomonadaceae bacterium]HBJ91972.1 hypothetical protein [Hyphomonadaceae bacterium]|tara:strand:- start:7750 stop:8190 length:441 start_codon:yes stop_codon:yes gene_type:complete